MQLPEASIYYEAAWVLVLFAATATLRESVGELCVHAVAKAILSSSHIVGTTLDEFSSCSNGGRSLGFGAAWRMWNIDKSGIVDRRITALPFCCWLVGLPIKLVAVQAIRGGNQFLGAKGTWALGIVWIVTCVLCKVGAIIVDKRHGLRDTDGKLVSYRRIFAARFCKVEGYGVMISPEEYDETQSHIKPIAKGEPLGVSCSWQQGVLRTSLTRRFGSDSTPNGLELMEKPDVALLYNTEIEL